MVKKLISEKGNVFLSSPLIVNIQLNNYCPLKCPYCFMNFDEKADISLVTLEKYLYELKFMGCQTVTFGQGEPMVSPIIFEAVKMAKKYQFNVKIATSGVGCTYNKILRLYEYGVNEFNISINSFDKNINVMSREGYNYAITAMKMARAVGLPFKVTYVAQENTMLDFEDYSKQAAEAGAIGISILREKVNSHGEINEYKDKTIQEFAKIIMKSSIPVEIEECFCELKLLLSNKRKAPLQGCAAGKVLMAITAKGEFLPCPHLYSKKEVFSSISQYWKESDIVKKLRNVCLSENPCSKCAHAEQCTTCQAIYPDEKDAYYFARVNCPVQKECE